MCVNTGTTAVTINPQPNATASSDSPVCVGSALHLSGGGGGTYHWTGPNGFVSNSQNPTITPVTAAAAGTYSLTVMTLCGKPV